MNGINESVRGIIQPVGALGVDVISDTNAHAPGGDPDLWWIAGIP